MEKLGHKHLVTEKTEYVCDVSKSIWEDPSHPSHDPEPPLEPSAASSIA
jgi:hypothetical protein